MSEIGQSILDDVADRTRDRNFTQQYRALYAHYPTGALPQDPDSNHLDRINQVGARLQQPYGHVERSCTTQSAGDGQLRPGDLETR